MRKNLELFTGIISTFNMISGIFNHNVSAALGWSVAALGAFQLYKIYKDEGD